MRTTFANTRQRILDTAERMFGENGFRGASLSRVSKEAGVAPSAVYYHFGSKEALLRELLFRGLKPVNDERLRLLHEIETSGISPLPEVRIESCAYPTGFAANR